MNRSKPPISSESELLDQLFAHLEADPVLVQALLTRLDPSSVAILAELHQRVIHRRATFISLRELCSEEQAARTIAGAEHLLVVTDKLEECSTLEVMRLGAAATGEAYLAGAHQLRSCGQEERARETFKKAEISFQRANEQHRAAECEAFVSRGKGT